MAKTATKKATGTKKAGSKTKTTKPRTDQTRDNTREGVDDPPGAGDPAADQTAVAAREEKERKAAARHVEFAIPVPQNPPEQPKMIPATQIPGATTSSVMPPREEPPARGTARIRVQAKAMGYYDDKLQRVGDVFDLRSEAEFSNKWMVRVPNTTPTHITGSPSEAIKRQKGETLEDARIRLGMTVGDDNVEEADKATGSANPLGAQE